MADVARCERRCFQHFRLIQQLTLSTIHVNWFSYAAPIENEDRAVRSECFHGR